MSEENYEPSERLKEWTAESSMMKHLSPMFERMKNLADKQDEVLPIIDLKITENKLRNERIEKLELQIEEMKKEGGNVSDEVVLDNPYPQIFIDTEAYQFFQLLHEKYKVSEHLLADYSFIYRMMYKENLIFENFRTVDFIKWLSSENYLIDELEKIKTLKNCETKEKILLYNTLKSIIYG